MDYYKVVFTETFLEDLRAIVTAIARHNSDAARLLGELIISTAEDLTFFPERHPRVRQRLDIRRFIVKQHFKTFYRVNSEARTVEILRCWDGRRGSEPATPSKIKD